MFTFDLRVGCFCFFEVFFSYFIRNSNGVFLRNNASIWFAVLYCNGKLLINHWVYSTNYETKMVSILQLAHTIYIILLSYWNFASKNNTVNCVFEWSIFLLSKNAILQGNF